MNSPKTSPPRAALTKPALGWFRLLMGRAISRDCALAAARFDRPAWVGALLRWGLDPDMKLREDGSRMSHMAAFARPDDAELLVHLLVGSGADIEALDENGLTPLGLAVSQGRTHLVRLWIKAGASVNPVPGGETPLMLALDNAPMLVELLLEHGARLDAAPIVDAMIHTCTVLSISDQTRSKGGMDDGDVKRLLEASLCLVESLEATGIKALSSEASDLMNLCAARRSSHGHAFDQALTVLRAAKLHAELSGLVAQVPRSPRRVLSL